MDATPSWPALHFVLLTGVSRFKVVEELEVLTPYRQCKVDYFPFVDDFTARKGEDEVDRETLLAVLTDFLKANNLKTDWQGVESAPNEALVNALAMMSPYGPPEKQALLEAPDLKTRAEVLIGEAGDHVRHLVLAGQVPLLGGLGHDGQKALGLVGREGARSHQAPYGVAGPRERHRQPA